jgi:hypothetical protein
LQPKEPEISEEIPIITHPDISDDPSPPVQGQLLQLPAPESGSMVQDHTPLPLSSEEDPFNDDDIGDMSKVPSFGIMGLKIESAKQDLELPKVPPYLVRH